MATSLINTECKRYGCMKNLLACYANCRYNSRCDDLRNEILPNLEQAANDINAYRRERELSSIEIQLMKRGVKFVDVAALQKNLAQGKKRSAKSVRKNKAKVKTEVLRAAPEKVETKAAKIKVVPQPEKSKIKAITRPKKSKIKATTRLEKPQAIAQKRIEATVTKKAIEPMAVSRELSGKKKSVVVQEKPRPLIKKKAKARRKKSILKPETPFKMAKKMKDSETENVNLTTETNEVNTLSATEKMTTPQRKKSAAQDAAAKKKKRMFIILDGEKSALVDEKGLMAKLLAGVSPNARYFEATEIELRLQIAHKK
jgi:hypothetical protein